MMRPPIGFPNIPGGNIPVIGDILKGIGKIAKYAWSVITGKDEEQEKIVNKKGLNPEKSDANEIAELNQLLIKYRQNISAAADDMEREMIVECSMMLQDIMDVFEEQNKTLKLMRTETIKRQFNRACKDLKGTFAEHVDKRFSLDDAKFVKILKMDKCNMKNQELQKMKQDVFVQAGNEVINSIRDTVDEFSDTVQDAFEEHLDRAEETIQNKADAFEELSTGLNSDSKALESVILKADYMISVCSYVNNLM